MRLDEVTALADQAVIPPALPAYPRTDGAGLRVWCAWCRRWHLHGIGYGHRAAHCSPPSPYTESGYVLPPPPQTPRRPRPASHPPQPGRTSQP